MFASCVILSECCEVDERSLILHDETDGEGENLKSFNCTYLFYFTVCIIFL